MQNKALGASSGHKIFFFLPCSSFDLGTFSQPLPARPPSLAEPPSSLGWVGILLGRQVEPGWWSGKRPVSHGCQQTVAKIPQCTFDDRLAFPCTRLIYIQRVNLERTQPHSENRATIRAKTNPACIVCTYAVCVPARSCLAILRMDASLVPHVSPRLTSDRP